jgi:hypothetical protein
MTKEFNIGLEYAVNGVIVRQEYEDGAPLVELVGDDYKELIDKLGCILCAELEDIYSSRIKLTIKVEDL